MGTRAAVAKVAGMVAVVRVVRMVVAARAAAKVEGGGGEGGGGDRGGSEGGRGDGGVDGAHHAVLAVDAVRRGAAHVAVGRLQGALRRISQSAVTQVDHRARCAEGRLRTHYTHPLARRSMCWWWRVSTQTECTIAYSVDGRGTGEVTNQAWRPSGMSSPSSHARAACWPKFAGENERAWVRVGASEHGWMGGAMCIPRGRGRPYRTVAMSLAREDYTRAPRWRARARIVLFSRERPISRFGQKKEKSTTCEPSTLRRSAWSRPSRGQRSASTSSPRRARTVRRKWAG